MTRAMMAIFLLAGLVVQNAAQRTESGYQSGSPASPVPVGWVFGDANGAMGVAYNDGFGRDGWGQVPQTEINGSGHLTYNNPNATTTATGSSWDMCNFQHTLLHPATWTLNIEASIYVLSQGFKPSFGPPYPAPGYIYAESQGVLGVWGDFQAGNGAVRVTDESGWVTWGPFGFADMGWTFPDGTTQTFRGGPHSGFCFKAPSYMRTNPQTYNPNVAKVTLNIGGMILPNAQTTCAFSYYSVGHVTVSNLADGAFMQST